MWLLSREEQFSQNKMFDSRELRHIKDERRYHHCWRDKLFIVNHRDKLIWGSLPGHAMTDRLTLRR